MNCNYTLVYFTLSDWFLQNHKYVIHDIQFVSNELLRYQLKGTCFMTGLESCGEVGPSLAHAVPISMSPLAPFWMFLSIYDLIYDIEVLSENRVFKDTIKAYCLLSFYNFVSTIVEIVDLCLA